MATEHDKIASTLSASALAQVDGVRASNKGNGAIVHTVEHPASGKVLKVVAKETGGATIIGEGGAVEMSANWYKAALQLGTDFGEAVHGVGNALGITVKKLSAVR